MKIDQYSAKIWIKVCGLLFGATLHTEQPYMDIGYGWEISYQRQPWLLTSNLRQTHVCVNRPWVPFHVLSSLCFHFPTLPVYRTCLSCFAVWTVMNICLLWVLMFSLLWLTCQLTASHEAGGGRCARDVVCSDAVRNTDWCSLYGRDLRARWHELSHCPVRFGGLCMKCEVSVLCQLTFCSGCMGRSRRLRW